MIVAETSRLILRHFQPDDAEDLQAVFGDAEVMRFSTTGAFNLDQIRAWLDRAPIAYEKNGYGLNAVIEKTSNQLIGLCGLLVWEDLDGQHEDEIGYRFARAWWGKGLATEAACATRDFGFGQLGRNRLISIIEPENVRSIRVAQRVGMQYERSTKFKNLDVGIYAMNRSSWENLR
ncbi:GNAT family N-acetyltransferase [Microcoleus sp. FACHB-1515]|uniref:GNAT family N-acetyltransferase n=1 Tax=Cyanophyceae TaxID=3028117 RepID=UPI001686986D|nr:GNAT family N-acetyltransferase [Microcoleus sp. FACHB-1515]MBD2089752.1 GNAT family N-acetyltransferase [Microcoleus sp. FACHB-1515]